MDKHRYGISDYEYIASFVNYNRESGLFTYSDRHESHFISKREFNIWRSRFSGKIAGYIKSGYLYITTKRKSFSLARLAWFIVNGEIPDVIDHIDGNTLNNSICNLRNTTTYGNAKNLKINSNNKSGLLGVYWHKKNNAWTASIRHNCVLHHLACTGDFFEAVCARKSAELKYGFHANHGKR